MVHTLTLVASLCVAFPDVPVGPATAPDLNWETYQQGASPPPPPGTQEPLPVPPPPPPPPLVPAELDSPGDAVPPDPETLTVEPKVRPVEASALATVTFPISDDPAGRDFLVGVRGELDAYFISAMFIWDRQGISPISLDETVTETNFWNGVIGTSVYAGKYGRIRLLVGLSSVSNADTAVFGPTFGGTVRFGIRYISVEAGALYTPAGFRQFDGRIEAVARVVIFEVRAGYRGRWIETEETNDRPFVLPTGGFTVSLGFTF